MKIYESSNIRRFRINSTGSEYEQRSPALASVTTLAVVISTVQGRSTGVAKSAALTSECLEWGSRSIVLRTRMFVAQI